MRVLPAASDKDNDVDLGVMRSRLKSLIFVPVAAYGTPGAKVFPCRPPEPPNSPVSFEVANSWLQTCLTEHETCGRGDRTTWPSRVVDVSTSDPDTIRLYKPSPCEQGQYACLSYCWGGPQNVTLTRSSLNRLFSGIPVRELGQTIRDAVEVTRRLGLRYLWVDALCIIQDSDEDKDVELSRMSKIYQQATVTIAAADPVSSEDGFLHRGLNPPPKRRLGGDRLDPFVMPFGADGTVQLYDNPCLSRYFQRFHLNSRAWTLQEMLLSPRVLFYTAEEPLWLCQADRANDGDGDAATRVPYCPRGAETVWPSPYCHETNASEREEWLEILRLAADGGLFWETWEKLVESYTMRDMTFPTDRLRAMQALIDAVQHASGHRCLHGHWEPWLIQLLPWYVLHGVFGGEGSSHRAPTGSPSWSWASVNDSVRFYRLWQNQCVTVLGVRDGDDALKIECLVVAALDLQKLVNTSPEKGNGATYFPDLPKASSRNDGL
ncbi:hypothetical protein VTJ49DRAFT_4719 [Mycothermus thermophilus]|uniref:Heterokaryon incompatibility domain-containing protein n=1 Tax=Humicola insolens TaxID=85995 RepID=A0ABR3V4P7_HUMIN